MTLSKQMRLKFMIPELTAACVSVMRHVAELHKGRANHTSNQLFSNKIHCVFFWYSSAMQLWILHHWVIMSQVQAAYLFIVIFFLCYGTPLCVFNLSTPLLVAEFNSRDKLSLCPWLKHIVIFFIAIIIFITRTSVLVSMPNLFLVQRL